MKATEIVSGRVRLRPLHENDLTDFAAIVADGETMRFLRHGVGLSGDEAADLLDEFISDGEEHEFGYWAVEDRRDGELLGYLGLMPYDRKIGDLEFLIARSKWGRGFATEAARAAVRLAFDTLRLTEVVAAVHPANRRAHRVLEKVGMSHRHDIRDAHGLKMHLYAVTALERRMLRNL
jgi:RimJ/RimL family protein N-acetyltransferase